MSKSAPIDSYKAVVLGHSTASNVQNDGPVIIVVIIIVVADWDFGMRVQLLGKTLFPHVKPYMD